MRGFGDLESQIMDRLWSWQHPATVREVLEDLRSEREIAYTTVMTVMDNLHRKGWLHRDRDGRAYRYRPVASRDNYSAELMREALTSSADHTATLVRFMEQLTPDEVAAMHRARRRLGRRRTP
ncbi:MAG: BlaI/MecI/CopY family transcriptional regulator [Mycobacteriales bacterium]